MQNARIRRITLVAVLAAMAAVVKIVFQVTTTGNFRFTLYMVPLIIVGMLLGPAFGALAGFVSDAAYGIALGYGLNLMTVSAMVWGFLAGIMLYKRPFTFKRLIILIIAASLLEFAINTVQLVIFQWQDDLSLAVKTVLGFTPNRVITMLLQWPFQIYLVKLLHERILKHWTVGHLGGEEQ